jgi:4a-hydroxytetrahydrobiopterin dehydratase
MIVREIIAPNFLAAVGLINAIALAAEKLDHHPDILLYGWNKLRISSTTHDRGGLTELDFKLAREIDAIANAV